MTALAPTLQSFFTDRLVRQRQASPHTLAAYRDTMRLLLRFAATRRRIEPVKLETLHILRDLIDLTSHQPQTANTGEARKPSGS